MTGKAPKADGFEDSTDWLETPLPKLSAFEAALRCQVCKDFYTNPMITSCSHTFCSLCIRRCLKENGICPVCRTKDQEIRLRVNNTVYDMVDAFKDARPQILEYTKERAIPVERIASPKRRREVSSPEEDGPYAKRTRSSRSSRRTGQSQTPIEVVDSDAEDEDFIPEAGVVECPVCQRLVKESTINAHLDRGCMDEPTKPKHTRASSIQNPAKPSEVKQLERLAQPAYSMLKDAPLRKKLLDQGLSVAGGRQSWERRYGEWVTLWNSNCDARVPKGKGELRRELDQWERTQSTRANIMNPGAQIKDKDFDGQAWAANHNDSFKDLIANARRNLPRKAVAPQVEEADDGMAKVTEEETLSEVAESRPTVPEVTSTTSMEGLEMKDDRGIVNGQHPALSRDASDTSHILKDIPNEPQHGGFTDDDGTDSHYAIPPSSQYPNGIPILEKDSSISSDMTTIETVQS